MKKFLSLFVAAAVIIGGAWFIYSKSQTPEQRLRNAFVNLINADDGHARISVVIEPAGEASYAALSEFRIGLDGDFQKGDDGKLNLDAGVTAEGSMPGASVVGKGAVRLADGKMFYKFDEVPAALADISAVRGKWILGASDVNILPDKARANTVAAFQEPRFFTSIKQAGKEKIGDFNTTHFQTTFSASGYAGFVEELTKLSGGSSRVSRADLEKGVQALNNVPFDIWIDSGNKLRKLAVSYVNPQNNADVKFEILLTNYSGKEKISEPAQSEIIAPSPETPIVSPVASPVTE